MKNFQKGSIVIILLIIIIAVIAGGIIFAYFKKPSLSLLKSSYNFEYKDGFKFWENSIDPKINTTFSKAVEAGYIESCTTDGKDPLSKVDLECRKAPGRLAIVDQQQIFTMPENQGFYTRNMRDSNAFPKSFYSPHYQTSEKFLLVPFGDYYVPSYYDVTDELLRSWKQTIIEKSNIPESEFSKKIRIIGLSLGGNEKYTVHAYYVDDWAQVSFAGDININWQKKIISKENLTTIVNNYEYPLTFDVNKLVFDKTTGDILLQVHGTKSEKNNECIFGAIDLITGVLKTQQGACWVS